MSCEKCGEQMKRKRSWALNGCPLIIRYCDCVEFTDALIKLERALDEIQDIGSMLDSMKEAEVAVKNAIQDMEKRLERYKKENYKTDDYTSLYS